MNEFLKPQCRVSQKEVGRDELIEEERAFKNSPRFYLLRFDRIFSSP